jgi:hypothetical protein
VFYTLWAVLKNYRYVQKPEGLVWLPLLQYTADLAVSLGTVKGLVERFCTK